MININAQYALINNIVENAANMFQVFLNDQYSYSICTDQWGCFMTAQTLDLV